VYTNRSFNLGTAPAVLPVVCFNACDACAPIEPTFHDVTFRVKMPDPSLQALLEVGGAVHEMAPSLWGSHALTVSVEASADLTYRYGTPAGALGTAWETPPAACSDQGWRSASITAATSLNVVCFSGCGACAGCADPFAANFDPLADPTSPTALCVAGATEGCTYEEADNFNGAAQWDDGSCVFAPAPSDCPDNNGDGLVGVNDVLILLSAFGDECP